jgi:hypothetical protein
MDVERELAGFVGAEFSGRVLLKLFLLDTGRSWYVTRVDSDQNGMLLVSGYEPHGRYGRLDRGLFSVDVGFFSRAAAMIEDDLALDTTFAGKSIDECPDDSD